MNVRVHIERLVVDEGVLARGEAGGLAAAIEGELRARLAGPTPAHDERTRDVAPPHVRAIGDGILQHIGTPVDAHPAPRRGPR